MRLFVSRAASLRLALIGLSLTAACSNDVTSPEPTPVTSTITVDASTKTVFVSLGAEPRVVTGADTATAAGWDINFNATNAAINATGGVTAYCACANQGATDATIMTLTADSQLGTFTAVDAASIPATTSFTADVFTTKKWYRYNLTGNDHQIWPTFDVYLVKRGNAVYKVQVAGYYSATGAPRFITIRSAQLRS
jgi:hypothetical protein